MSTSLPARRLLLSLSDVAALARVQRPVPSMWRSRAAGGESPFPAAQVRTGNQERFDAEEVASWLELTGHGNNPDVRDDLALFAAFDESTGLDRRAAFDGLTALLALAAITGEQLAGRSSADLRDLADDADPRDRILYREIAALDDDLATMAEYADAMASAAYTPAAAFEALMAHRFRLGIRDYAETALAPAAVRLVAGLALGLVIPEKLSTTTFVDPSAGSDLLVALRALLPDEDLPDAAIGLPSSPSVRFTERRLVTHGWLVAPLTLDGDGRIALPRSSVLVAQYPSPGAPTMSDDDVLAAVDDVALAMDDDDRAVVIGPAGALANASRSRSVESARSALLRTDRVRAIIRLPAGQRTAKPRQQLAIWVLGPAHPDVAIADRWVTVADLSAIELDDATIADLVTDVVAAMGDRDDVRGHAFRFVRFVHTRSLLASSGNLVGTPRPRPRVSRQEPAEVALQVNDLIEIANTGRCATITLGVEHHERTAAQITSIGELVASGKVRLVPGNRLDARDVVSRGDVRLIGSDELLGARQCGDRTLDRLTFSAQYPAGRYTEPGDVVFCTAPGVGALVDLAGFSVVLSPARVLRIDRSSRTGLIPEVLARDIASAASARGWRTCAVRLVPATQAGRLRAALQQVAAEISSAGQRVASLEDLANTLTDGVASGVLTLTDSTIPDDDHAKQEG